MFFSMHKQLSNDVCFTTVTKPRAHQHRAILLSAGHPSSELWESKRSPCSLAQKLDLTGWGWSEQGNNPQAFQKQRHMPGEPWQLSRKGYTGRDAPNKLALKSPFQYHIVTPSRDGNDGPVLRIYLSALPECGQHREGYKNWPRTLGSSVLEAQVMHFVTAWLA